MGPHDAADVLVAAGKPDEAKQYFDAAIQLAPNADFAKGIARSAAIESGDLKALLDPKSPLSAELSPPLLAGYRAVASGNAAAKAQAAQALVALPQDQQGEDVARLLAALGADHEAFQIAVRLAAQDYPGPSLFWYRSMRRTLDDPGFPAAAAQLGLMKYWKRSHTRPDVCNEKAAPLFCRTI